MDSDDDGGARPHLAAHETSGTPAVGTPAPRGTEGRPAPVPPDGLAVLVNRSARPGDYYDTQFCGAVLVTPRLVLTAGHCLDGRDPRQVAILIGVADLCDPDVLERRRVQALVQTPAMERADLMGLRLSGPSTLTPVPVTPTREPATHLVAMGFGLRDVDASSPCEPKHLRLQPTSAGACRDLARAGGRRFDAGAEVCTLPAAPDGANTCLRDSGSPVLVFRRGVPRLVAVVTWGAGCSPDDPGVNARASAARVIDR